MGAIFVAWLVVGVLPPPPTDDGLACQRWAVDEASALIASPQPPATALDGETTGGLSEIPDGVWAEIATLGYPDWTDGGSNSWRALREGSIPVAALPQVAETLRRTEGSVRRVLRASLGPANGLSDPWQVWCAARDCPGDSSADRARYGFPVLGLAFGWRGLEEGRLEDALLACTGVAGFLRASGGTGLIGQMLAISYLRGLSLLCLATASRSDRGTARRILEALGTIEREWPPFSHTLRQELVFGQLYDPRQLSSELRARIPARWLGNILLSSEEQSWVTGLRGKLFGPWAMRELCLRMAGLVEVADKDPTAADPRFQAAGESTFLWRLAREDGGGSSNWLGFARRMRRLTTELRMLNAGLEAISGSPANCRVDARTGHPLEVRGAGADRVVVAVADPAFAAEELRLPVPGGTPSRP